MVTNASEAHVAHCHNSEQNLNEAESNSDSRGSIFLQNLKNHITVSQFRRKQISYIWTYTLLKCITVRKNKGKKSWVLSIVKNTLGKCKHSYSHIYNLLQWKYLIWGVKLLDFCFFYIHIHYLSLVKTSVNPYAFYVQYWNLHSYFSLRFELAGW
jgi:hypothetical protein